MKSVLWYFHDSCTWHFHFVQEIFSTADSKAGQKNMSVRRKPRNPQCSPIMDPVKYCCILRIHSCPHWTKRWWINSSTFISHLGPKLVWKETLLEVSLWHSRLRCCYWSSSGHCWGPGSIPSPGISARRRRNQKKESKEESKEERKGRKEEKEKESEMHFSCSGSDRELYRKKHFNFRVLGLSPPICGVCVNVSSSLSFLEMESLYPKLDHVWSLREVWN